MKSKLLLLLGVVFISCNKEARVVKQPDVFDQTVNFHIVALYTYSSPVYQHDSISVQLNLAREQPNGVFAVVLDTLIRPKNVADKIFQGVGVVISRKVSGPRVEGEHLRCSYILSTFANGYWSQFASGKAMSGLSNEENILIRF